MKKLNEQPKRTYTKREVIILAAVSVLISTLVLAAALYAIQPNLLGFSGIANLGFGVNPPKVHVTVTVYQYGHKISESSHPGAVTNFLLNTTFAKLTGYSTFYNMTTYNLNATYVGIGYMSSGPNATSTILDGEWNRTLGTIHDPAYNHYNITAVFHPDTGPYSANVIGVYLEASGNSLMFYDTISPAKTGIDNTFTITVEFELSAS